jgi:hypothetical protein
MLKYRHQGTAKPHQLQGLETAAAHTVANPGSGRHRQVTGNSQSVCYCDKTYTAAFNSPHPLCSDGMPCLS